MNFQELGLAIKQERERQGLSIDLVMESTKISRTNIVAIENGDRSTLPHPVYAKGFIKSYARFLGMDADELSMAVDNEYQDEADGPEEHIYEVSPAAERAFQENDSPEMTGRAIWPYILIVVLLVAGGIFFYMSYSGDDVAETPEPAATEQAEEVPQPDPPAPVEQEEPDAQAEEAAGEAAAEAGESADGATEAAPQDDAAATPSAEEAQAETPAVTTPEADPEQPVVAPQPAEPVAEKPADKPKYDHMLVIRATTEKGCWIGVWKGDDPNMSSDFVLQQGEPLRLMFNSPRRIRIGNVSGVTVTYNGAPYELAKNKSNIQTLRFGFAQ